MFPFIGMNDRAKEGRYGWSDGTIPLYRAWKRGEPNNYLNEDCAQINWGFGTSWNDVQCSKKNHYICKFDASRCEGQFLYFGRSKYFIPGSKKTWEDAEDDCVSNGGHLASIHSKEENDFLYNELVQRWGKSYSLRTPS